MADDWIIEDKVEASTAGVKNASHRLETFMLSFRLEVELGVGAEVDDMTGW
jgi:hypothetical protein